MPSLEDWKQNEKKNNPKMEVDTGHPCLMEKYKRALEVIYSCNGDLKDYTYLSLLVTETGKLFTAEKDFLNSGTLEFTRKILEENPRNMALLPLALNLIEIMIQVDELRLKMLQLLNEKLDSILEESDNSVMAAMFQCCMTIQKSSTAYCPETIRLFTQRKLLDSIFWSLNASTCFHVTQLAIRCYLAILTYMSQQLSSTATLQNLSGQHVNLAKLRHNLLLDLFEKVTNSKKKLGHLKFLMRHCENPGLKKELSDFIVGKLFQEPGNCDNSADSCILRLLTSPKVETAKALLTVPDQRTRQILLYQMTRMLQENGDFEALIIDYLSTQATDSNFVRYITCDDDVIDHVIKTRGLFTFLLEKCDSLWIQHSQDLSEHNTQQILGSILKFHINCNKKRAKPDENKLADFLLKCKQMLQRYLGVPDSLKAAICDLIKVVYENGILKSNNEVSATDFIQAVSYLAISSASTWQLKDSALEALAAILSQEDSDELLQESKDVLKNVILNGHQHGESYVRGSSFKLLSVYIHTFTISTTEELEFITKIEATMLFDQEAIVRRICIDALSAFVLKISKENLVHLLNIGLHAISSDLDWEVKKKSAKFWSNVVTRLKTDFTARNELNNFAAKKQLTCYDDEQLITALESHGVLTALLLGCQDYEAAVREEYIVLTEAIMQEFDLAQHSLNKLRKLDLEDSSKGNIRGTTEDFDYEEEDIVDTIESVVEAEDSDLLKNLVVKQDQEAKKELTKVKKQDLNEFLQEYTSLEQKAKKVEEGRSEADTLVSILEDIIHSDSGDGLVEIIDCY
eukprot:TRINITY_DN3295_c0_g1_i8.p1 TRINITY_DN3295_c0_g1~~TRINITY_DN3295_c0_g1_i8.p1  ORF type:complete len:801 (-),score=178.46 TRINITY_DN3295_c0_g1_i8:1-2403(-)